MSETSDRLLRGYQAQERRFLERRPRLRFASENPTLRELYRQAKRFLSFRPALPGLDAAGRAAVGEAVRDMLERVILAGYRNTWLLPAEAREPLLAAEALTAQHGLGASTVAQEKAVVRATLAQVRERLAGWNVTLPHVEHPELGRA